MHIARFLISLSLAASVAGCTEVVRHYRADSSGKLRHVGTYLPEWGRIGKHVSYTLNGTTFDYDLSVIRGDVRGHRQPPSHLKAGDYFQPFSAGSDASLLEAAFDAGGVTWYSGNIRALSGKSSPANDIFQEIVARGISKRVFAKSPPIREYRSINGRRWLVTTHKEQNLITNRTFWAIENGFLVTFNVNFVSAPTDPAWRESRLATLEKIVSRFQMHSSG